MTIYNHEHHDQCDVTDLSAKAIGQIRGFFEEN